MRSKLAAVAGGGRRAVAVGGARGREGAADELARSSARRSSRPGRRLTARRSGVSPRSPTTPSLRLLRALRRPVAVQPGSLLHGRHRRGRRPRRRRRPLRRRHDVAEAGRRAVPAVQPRSRGPRAHEGPAADPDLGGQHEHAARPVRPAVRLAGTSSPTCRCRGSCRLPTTRAASGSTWRSSARACRRTAASSSPRPRTRSSRTARRLRRPREPVADPALQPPDRPARPRVPLRDRPGLQPPVPPTQFAVNGIVELLPFNNEPDAVDGALVLGRRPRHRQRDQALLVRSGCDERGRRSLAGKLDSIRPAQKTLLLDLGSLGIPLDNVEGMTLGPTARRTADSRWCWSATTTSPRRSSRSSCSSGLYGCADALGPPHAADRGWRADGRGAARRTDRRRARPGGSPSPRCRRRAATSCGGSSGRDRRRDAGRRGRRAARGQAGRRRRDRARGRARRAASGSCPSPRGSRRRRSRPRSAARCRSCARCRTRPR